MTTENTTTIDTEKKEPTAEEQAQAEQQAEADFAAGFNKVHGKEDAPATDPKDKGEQQTDETTTTTGTAADASAAAPAGEKKEGAAAAAAAPVKDPWEGVHPVVRQKLEAFEQVTGRIRNIEGHIGGLNSKLDSALATAKAAATEKGGAAAAPSDAQVVAALADPKAWDKLKEDYPDWAGPMEAEFKAIRTEMQALEKKAPAAVDVEAIKADVKKEVRTELAHEAVDEVHAGWRETVKTPEFAGWLKTQPKDTQALALSTRPRDAIKLLDGFKSHADQAAKAAADAAAARDKTNKRLAGAVTPKGTSAPLSTGISDEAAFERGFQKARKKA